MRGGRGIREMPEGKISLFSRLSRGMTLAEAVLAAMLVGIVGLSFAALMGTTQRYLVQSVNHASAQGEASFALEHMKRHLMRATQVTLNSPTQITFTWVPTQGATPLTSRYQWVGGDLQFIQDTINSPNAIETIARKITLFQISLPQPLQAQASPPQRPWLSVVLKAKQSNDVDAREVRLETVISPRGIP